MSGLTVGGIVGEISSVGSIKNSSAYFRLMDNGVNLYRSSAGGLIGYSVCYDKVSVSQSSAAVDINLTAIHCLTGGIAAMSKNIDIVNCYATGAITASGRNINPQSQCMSGGIRLEYGLTQRELGGKLGYCNQTISFWESGQREPDLDALVDIAEFFDVPIGVLLGLKN